MADPVTLALLLGGGSFLGGLFGKNKTKQTQTSTSVSSPTFDPAFMGVRDRLLRSVQRAPSGFDLARNITNQRLGSISTGANAAETGLKAKLQAMGIRGGGAANPLGNLAMSAFGESAGALNEEPLLAHQFDNEQIDQLLSVLNMGRGSTTKTTGTGTNEGGGGPGQGFADLGEMLGWLASQGAFTGMKKGAKGAKTASPFAGGID